MSFMTEKERRPGIFGSLVALILLFAIAFIFGIGFCALKDFIFR